MEERLQKVLARAGIASRRKAEELILDGRVSVNGRPVRELGTKVDPELDEIAVDTVPLPRPQAAGEGPRTYILLYKPRGVLCTVQDTHGRPTVLDVVPPFPGKRLYPVGRLDEDSEGLVLLTNDGDLTARLTHPRYGVPKMYEVRVKGHVTRDHADQYEKGVWLSEGRTGRSRVFVERAGRETSHVRVTLTEGRNREIRRAWAKLGFAVLSIKRIQIGPVVGRGLEAGQFRPLAPDEVEALRASASGEGSNEPMRRSGGRRPRPEAEESPRPRRRGGKPDPARFAAEGRPDQAPRGGRSGRGRPAGGRPQGDRRRDDHRRDDRRRDDRPYGGPPRSGPPRGGRPQGDRPQRGRPHGDSARGGRPHGGGPRGGRPGGGRPGDGRGRGRPDAGPGGRPGRPPRPGGPRGGRR